MAVITATPGTATQSNSKQSFKIAFALVTALFFSFGFITCLNDILVPHLKSLFTLNYTEAALIQFCFFSAYFFMSLPSGKIVSRIGYKRGTIVGAVVTAFGCLLFYPAAELQSYWVFLFGFFILASGITLIQVAVNPYVAVLGPAETASGRLTLAQAFNSLGTTIAPLFGSFLILSASSKSVDDVKSLDGPALAAYHTAQAHSVQGPYIGLAVALCILAVIVSFFKLPSILSPEDDLSGVTLKEELSSAWRYRHLLLGAIGIFTYVGAEVAIGSYLVNFINLPEIGGIAEATAAKYVSLYWGGAMVGRFIGAAVLQKVRPGKVLTFNAICAGLLVLIAMISSGPVAMYAILAVGLFNSIMFPTIFTLAIKGLGKHTPQGSGVLCMAIVGGAVIPLVQGTIADALGLHHSFILPVICYGFIAYYGLEGYKHIVRKA